MELSEDEMSLFELAAHLRIPLYRLVEEMPYEELLGWYAFLKKRPLGWREDYRAGVVASAFGGKMPLTKMFPSLEPILNVKPSQSKTLVHSAFFQAMLGAKGGDSLDFLKPNEPKDTI